jgi:L-ascorbate metabolism protein UlaG (beta-lactamase superfamily)
MAPMHVDPEEAVMVYEDVRAEHALGIHWGTFKMTREVGQMQKKKRRKKEKKFNCHRNRYMYIYLHIHCHYVL